MWDWTGLIMKIPFLKKSWDWVTKKVIEYLLEKKSLILTLHWNPSSNSNQSFTVLMASNKCKQDITFLYSNKNIAEITLYSETKKGSPPKTFPLTIEERPFAFRQRIEPEMFYISPRVKEVFHIPNNDKWFAFISNATSLFLRDSERTSFYVDKKSIEEVRKKLACERAK